jgi:RNA polymerase sigma factor (sigma-70 family)
MWAVEYMVTGYMPMGEERKMIPTDPQMVLDLYSSNAARTRVNREKIQAVEQILSVLTEQERQAVTLVWGQNMSLRQASYSMDITTSSLRSYLSRARKKLQEQNKKGE